MNIYQKLLNITNEIGTVNKNLIVGEGKSSYKAVGEADVLKAVKELENKYGIYSYPVKRNLIDSQILLTEKEYKNNVVKSTKQFMRIETIYRFVNVEKPDEFIEVTTYGDGIDVQDKAPGKAMTYSDKYALLKAYKMITGDDPDQNISEETEWKVTNKVSETEAKTIYRMMINKGLSSEVIINTLKSKYNINSTNELTKQQYVEILKKLNEDGGKK